MLLLGHGSKTSFGGLTQGGSGGNLGGFEGILRTLAKDFGIGRIAMDLLKF